VFKAVFVPLEGTGVAARAVGYGSAIARACRATLVLYHWTPPLELEHHPADERAAADQLQRLAAESRRSGINVETIIDHEFHQDEAVAILDSARARNADLVVLASHGGSDDFLGMVTDGLLGNAAERVAQSAEAAVLVVPTAYDQRWDSEPELHTLLVPLDGSPEAEAALPAARALGEALRGRVLLARLMEPGSRDAAQRESDDAAVEALYLDDLASAMRAAGLQVDTVVEAGQPESRLARLAEERGADLIVMASHGRSGFQRLRLGSVTESTLRGAHVPVLVLHRPG
jgi:nucleotide-binding universal stress UspA family protein